MSIIDDEFDGFRLTWAHINEIAAAGILLAEGAAPPLPDGETLVTWVRWHVSAEVFTKALVHAVGMSPTDRGIHLRRAIDGECNG